MALTIAAEEYNLHILQPAKPFSVTDCLGLEGSFSIFIKLIKMKIISAFIICLLLIPAVCLSQSDKWTLSLDYGLQAHDKRLFDWPTWSILERTPGIFGTHQFGVRAVREMAAKGRLQLFAGAGIGFELATFSRPFDYYYGQKYRDEVLRYTDRYYRYLLQTPVKARYRVLGPINLSMEVLPQFNFLTRARDTYSKGRPPEDFNKWGLDLYSVEFNPGIEYTKSRVVFSLRYRAFQVKRFDRILFSQMYFVYTDPPAKTFETYNPFKLWFSVAHKF